ncbi:gliding motility-associated-like protein [Ancylomarina subtilis]|uniref:Gliding motility-associated-like protein n=1 Tax=Ancylomarina subtilis TaxID=1639035 RepID=A0A4Q7VKZ5_9BACT|nr:gliding motility-associated C-terminal domain-containing protein [Ancylomarina subtilis]RZT96926.1 gliding motility-associated-like protein [Ancylomarina subtilis]
MDTNTVNDKRTLLPSTLLFKLFTFFVLSLFAPKVFAQLDYIHYVPPLYNGSNTNKDIGRNVVVITTDSRELIDVWIYKGDNNLLAQIQVSRFEPYRYVFETSRADNYGEIYSYPTDYEFPIGVVGANELNTVLDDAGLKFISYDAPIYVNMRHITQDQGGSLTTKGRFAMGKEFRTGHVYTANVGATFRRAHFFSVMATEDNTTVKFTDIKTEVLTQLIAGSLEPLAISALDTITVLLQKGQSYVIGIDHDIKGFGTGNMNALNGTHILSDKDIVVNTGSWTSGSSAGQDMGIDQIVPYEQIRDKYIVLKGEGNSSTEVPIVVPTEDGTDIYLNGSSTPINSFPLNAGEPFLVTTGNYYNDKMYIDTKGKNVYVYQTLSGSSSKIGPTVGMNFIAPLSATGMHQVDIPFADQLAIESVNSVITILAQKGATVKYENIIDGVTTEREFLPSEASTILGTEEWVSYRMDAVVGNIRFQSSRALNVCWTVQTGVVGSAGYYSGFSKAIPKIIPDLHVDLETDLSVICESYNDNIVVDFVSIPDPDFYEWYRNEVTPDSLIFENEKLNELAPDVPTKYILKAYYRDPTLDILYNGDFSSGRGNFETDYEEVSGNLRYPGQFALTFSPQSENSSFVDFDDMEGGGLMFLAMSGGVPGDTVYQKLDIPIERNSNYIIKVHGRMAQANPEVAPQSLDVYINDERVKSNFLIDDASKWKSTSALWKSKDNQKATISLIDANASGNIGVFAIDSITFVPAVQDSAEFNALVIPNYSFTPYNKPQHFCLGQLSGNIDISNGDTSWYTYVWERKNGENDYIPIAETNVSGTDSYNLVFNNITNDNAGVYRCSINFKEEYQQCGMALEPAQVEVEVVVDELAQILSLTEGSNLCEGEFEALEVNVEGKYSRIAWSVNGVEKAEGKVFDFNLDKAYSAGVYTIRCDVENACQPLSREIEIEIFGKPNLTDLQVPTNLCDQESVNLTAVCSVPADATMEYSWYRDNNLIETNNLAVFSIIPDMSDAYYKVAVAARYNIGGLDEHTCVGNELVSNLAADAVYPQVVLTALEPVTLCEGLSYLYKTELETSGDYYIYNWEVPVGVTGDKTNADFNLINIKPAMAGNYKVTVTNRCGSSNSTSLLTVTPKMEVTDITIDKVGPYCDGENVTITVVDNGYANFYKAENVTVGQEQIINPMANPFVFAANSVNRGQWEITAEGNCGTVYQEPFTINLLDNFSDPSLNNITTCYGEDVKFEVQIATKPTGSELTYTWTDPNGDPIVVADPNPKNVVNILDVQLEDLGIYTCEIENKCGYKKIVTATLSVECVTSALTAPAVEVCQGTTDYSFDIAYVGTPTFEWRFNTTTGAPLSTLDHYTIPTVEKANEGIYYCDITLACGTVLKYQRQLVVNDHISVVKDPSAILDICEGDQTELIIDVTGTPTSIKWFDNGNTELTAYEGETRISTGIIGASGSYTYTYKLTGDCENPEGSFVVTVHAKPSIAPIAQINACVGDVDLNMVVTSIDPATSSWWNSDESAKVADGLNHTLSGMTYSGNLLTYTAVTNTAFCSDVKTTAQVYIYKPIAVVSNSDLTPKPCVGEPLSLIVKGTGDDLSYNWFNIADPAVTLSSGTVLDLGAAELIDEGDYRCELISGNGCGNVNVDFTVDVREHAKITLQPTDETPCEGDGSVTFKVMGTAEDAPSYQWYEDDVLISDGGDFVGTTTTDLTVSNLLGNENQSYHCKVSGDYCDPIDSEKASLTVNKNVVIKKDPVSITIAEDGVATFTVEAEGTGPFTYQWYEDNLPMGGEISATLTIDPATIGLDGHKYKCLVSNACSTDVASAEAILTVDPAIKITEQPVPIVICEGADYKFVVVYKNSATDCVWEYSINNGVSYSAATVGTAVKSSVDGTTDKSTLTVSNATAVMDGWRFRALVTAPDNYSSEVSVQVDVPASFDPIADKEICIGSGASFSVNGLSGSTPYTYQWIRGADNIGDDLGINSSLNLIATEATNGTYSIGVKAGVCPVEIKNFNISHFDDLVINGITDIDPVCHNVAEDIEVDIALDPVFNSSVTYAWTKDGGALTGTTDEAKYNIKGLDNSETGLYKVEVTDGCGTKSSTRFVNVFDEIVKTETWDYGPLCVGDALLLEAKVTGDNPTYTWTIPAGSTNPGNVATLKIDGVVLENAGTYTCVVSGTCGTDVTYTVDIVINDVPNITAGLEALTGVCVNEPLILGPIIYDATTGESILWKFNDGVIAGETSESLNLANADFADEGNYRVEVTNACGTDFSLGFQDVHPIPTLAPIDNQTACQGENVIFRAVTTGENLTYRWFIDDVARPEYDDQSEIEIPNIQPFDVNTPKNYKVECQVNSCNTDLDETAYVLVNPNTILNTSIKGEVVYVGIPHVFDLDVTGSDLTFEWHHIHTDGTDETLEETTKTLTIDYLSLTDAGEYSCKITGECGVRFTSGYLTVKDPMRIVEDLGGDAIEKCFGEPLNLNISVEGEVFSINWFKGADDLNHHELNFSIPALDVSDAGFYRCEIVGEGANIKDTVNVVVYQTTVLNSDLKDEVLCENDDLLWTLAVSGSFLTYDWKHNGKTVSTDPTLNILNTPMDSAGIYSVDITGKCGVVSTEANLTLKKLPYFISKSDDLEKCENDAEAIFSVNYGGDNLLYQWQKDNVDIEGANSSELKIQNLRTSDAGVYKCVVSSGCGFAPEAPVQNLVVIPQLKILSESPGMEICDGEEAQFIVEVEGTDEVYQWQKNGIAIPGENAPQLAIGSASLNEEGYYSCEVSDKCTARRYSNSKKLTVNELPNSQIFGRMTLCVLEDRVAYNTAIQPDINYGWLVEGGEFTSPSEGFKTKITWGDVIEDGKVKLKILNEATGCYSEVDSLVTLHPLPVVTLASQESRGICDSEFELGGGLPVGGIYWVNGVAQNTFDPSQGNGEYQVRYSYTDDLGCSNTTDETLMTIDSLPVVKLIEDVVVGSCGSKELSAVTEENNIKWSPSRYLDDPNSLTPTFTSGETTLYVATVVDKHGCVGNDIVNVTVAPLPLITTINDTIIGECKEIELTTHISGDIDEITWSNAGDLDNSKSSNPKLIKPHVGVNDYQISVTDKYGCLGSASIKVEVLPNPEIGENQFLCEGETLVVDIKDLSNPIWKDGYTAWERIIDKPGEYELSVEENDCELKQKIVMNPSPKFELDNNDVYPGIVIFEGETYTLAPDLDPDYGPYTYTWSDSSVLPELVVVESGTYKLKVEDNIGCVATDTVVVDVKPIGIESPNAFTPLSKNENDRFYLKDINVTDRFEMYIYNRWGELLYKTNEAGYANGWDGTYKGEDCPVGAYVWVLMLDGKVKEKGNVILVR